MYIAKLLQILAEIWDIVMPKWGRLMFAWALKKFLNICNFFYFNRRHQLPFFYVTIVQEQIYRNLRTSVDNFWFVRHFLPTGVLYSNFFFYWRWFCSTSCFQFCEKFSSFFLVITPFLWISFQQSNSAKGGYKGLTRRKSWQSTKF